MLTLLLTLATPAHAAPWTRPPRRPLPPRRPPPVQVEAPHATKQVSLTVSAVDLTQGMGTVSAEIALARKSSLALSGGLGAGEDGLLYKVGLDGRQYLLGDFDTGLYLGLGVEGGNQHLFLPERVAFAVGPTLGAKFTVPVVPLTLQAGGGVDLVVGDGYAAVAPTLEVGLGFSF